MSNFFRRLMEHYAPKPQAPKTIVPLPEPEPEVEYGVARVYREPTNVEKILSEYNNDAATIGRTVDGNILLIVPGHVLPTIFVLVLRHGNSICELVNSMGYFVDKMVNDGGNLTTVEQLAKMSVELFKSNGHGPMVPYPLIAASEGREGRDDRFIATLRPAQFVELYSSYNEMMSTKPGGLSPEVEEQFMEVHQLFTTAMTECIEDSDIMATMGGATTGSA